jgi:hypothetical protein
MDELFLKITEFLTSAMGVSATVAVVLEFIFRLIPSKKPLSILWVIVSVAKKLSEILALLAKLGDKVLPQVVEEPKEFPELK